MNKTIACALTASNWRAKRAACLSTANGCFGVTPTTM